MPDQQQKSASSKPRLLVRACRKLWQAMLYIWGTLMVGIIIGTIANINTTMTDTPLSKLYIIYLAQTFPFPVFSILVVLILVTFLAAVGSLIPNPVPPQPFSDHNRTYMLRRLQLRYEQMLAQSLQGAIQVELGLASRSRAVQQTASLALRLPEQPDQPFPPHTSIIEVYKQAQQELLILGEPGAGKSNMLVELAHHLVEQAEQDTTQPLPVLLPLSSWATERLPLQNWLIEQVASLYDVPKILSMQWVQARQILPLLDGLDEMDEAARPACIEAINAYHREHLEPLVVCSRTNEYDRASKCERLILHTAVIVQPLPYTQVDAHLAMLGKPLAGLRTALKKQILLRMVATTPLMLQILILTYYGTSVRELPQKEAQLREQIWIDYIQKMVKSKGNVRRYPLDITITRLKWLAFQMRSRNQTIFYLEQLQPDWLHKRQRIWYQSSAGLLSGLLIGLFSGLIGGLLGKLIAGLVGGSIGGLFIGQAIGWLLFRPSKPIKPAEALSWSKNGPKFGLFVGLLLGLIGGPPLGLVIGLIVGLLKGLIGGLIGGPLFGLAIALLGGGLSGKQLTERLMLSPNEGIQRSLKNGLLLLSGGLLFGVPFGLIVGLLFGPPFGLIGGWLFGLIGGLSFGMSFGLLAVIQHYTLRFWLTRSRVFPWKAIPFLEDATARIFLRRVGGGYSFTHRLLLDHFVDMGDPPANSSPTQATPP